MKKFLNITLAFALVLACTLALASCGACASHTDMDENGLCDVCGVEYSCPGHKDVNGDKMCDFCLADFSHEDHFDKNSDGKCDRCGAAFECPEHIDADEDGFCETCYARINCEAHTDADGDGKCDKCAASFSCTAHTDKNGDGYCDICAARFLCQHKDSKETGFCEICGAEFLCEGHVDAGGDGRCDKCHAVFVCEEHTDADENGKCDICQKPYTAPKDLRKDFMTAAAATNPERMVIAVTTKFEGYSLTDTYTVTFNGDGTMTIVIVRQDLNLGLDGELIIDLPPVTVTRNLNGVYSDGNGYDYLTPALKSGNIDLLKLKNFESKDTSSLKANILAADTKAVLGTDFKENVLLVISKNATELTALSISYSNVDINCIYN